MNRMTLSEKYALLIRNEEGRIGSIFGNEKQGLYVCALLELYCEKVVLGFKQVKVSDILSDENQEVKVMYDFVCKKEGKSIKSIMNSFINPFNNKIRKELMESIICSMNFKMEGIDDLAYLNELMDSINSLSMNDVETTVLVKILIELNLGKKYIDKQKRKELKLYFREADVFNEEIKQILSVIDSLATAGALAGAGVV